MTVTVLVVVETVVVTDVTELVCVAMDTTTVVVYTSEQCKSANLKDLLAFQSL